MAKELILNCSFRDGKIAPVKFYVGESAKDSHPLHFQRYWLTKEYGADIPKEIIESLQNLKDISIKSHLKFEELCDYVFEEVNAAKEIEEYRKNEKEKIKHIAQQDRIKVIEPNDE